MKDRQKRLLLLLVLLSVAVILIGGSYYLSSVRSALWNKSVTDILEVTVQGRHALDTYVEKDLEMVHLLAQELSQENARDSAALLRRVRVSEEAGAPYLCADLDTGMIYTPLLEAGYPAGPDLLEPFLALEGQGIREPFLDGYSGVWTLGYYEQFTFADGSRGLIQKSRPLREISDRFSLSFYNDTGFSYVVDRTGEIMIRSQHRNSNRTFQNLFDIIDLQGNDPQVVRSFRQALEEGRQGVARFHYQTEEYVFCYVPMERAEGWYVVSIVPNRVIMEQAETIVQNSQIFLVLTLAGLFLLTAFFLVYRNSTRRVLQAEEEARKAAESANRAKSRFLSNMSHDIRTPMNAIIGMTKLATDHMNEPDKVREYLKNIGQSGQLLVGLINDILDLSKIESGKMSLNNDNASLETLLTNLVSIVQPIVEKKRQKFDIRLHGVQHEMLYFDALRMNQLLLNLLSNATKFTPEEGSIAVDVTERPSPLEDHTHLTFRVSDTGIGIDPAFMDHIFDSFTREQDSRISQIEGSGLGMAITKMIVNMMGGTIAVESAPGQGTVFTVDLDVLLPMDVPQTQQSLPGVRVLLADDDPATCRSVEAFLRELGVTADVTESGRQAVELAKQAHDRGEDHSLVLLDWRMPEFGGVEAAQAIREQVGPQVPVVVVSANDWSEIERQALEAGVSGFIQKPLFKSTLYRCIRQYVFHEVQPEPRRSETMDLTGRRILLAEDNPLNQEIVRELLGGMGARVETADNGLQCVERFEQSPPGTFDLILMDVQMPILNGYEATLRIRALDRPDAAIPIFAMTADAFTEDIELARQCGMNCHLAKPLDISQMLRELQKYLPG